MALAPPRRSFLAGRAAILAGLALAPGWLSAEDRLDRRLTQALAALESGPAAERPGAASAAPAPSRPPQQNPLAVFRALLRDLERRDTEQRKAFQALAAMSRGEDAGRVEEARAAHDRTHGRLLRIMREIVSALEARANGKPSGGDMSALVREALEILDELAGHARREPISFGEPRLRGPQLQPPPLGSLAGSGGQTTELPVGEQTIPQVLRDAAATFAGPIEIYEWVRNNIRPDYYFGVMKGPVQTYLERSGNDADTAGLLVALLRAKGLPARYAYGTVEVSGPSLVGFTGAGSVEAAVRVLERAGIPHEVVLGAGTVAAVKMDHVWAEAYVPYDNYRGTLLDPYGKAWVPLDPGFKRLEPPTGLDVVGELGLDMRALLDEYLAGLSSATPLEFLRAKVGALLADMRPGTSYADVLNRRALVPETLGILPGVLPYKLAAPPGRGAEPPAILTHRLRIVGTTAQGQTVLDVTLPTSDLLGNRLTLAYVPASPRDEEWVRRFGGLLRVPPYLVEVRPVLKSRGIPIAAGSRIGLGRRYSLRLELVTPGGTETIVNSAIAGNLTAVGLGGREVTGVERRSDTAGEILSGLAWSYLDRWNRSDDELSSLLHVVPVRPTLSFCLVMSDVDVFYYSGEVPYEIQWKGLLVDADLRSTAPVGVGSRENERPFLLASGLEGSILENRIFEDRYGLASVSTAKALQLARAQGIEVRDFVGDTTGLDELPLDPTVKAEVEEAVSRGFLARVPVADLTYLDWTGVGYLILDEETGEAAYQLLGGHSGGSTALPPGDFPPDLRDPLINQGEEPAPPGTEVAKIEKFGTTDFQEGTVNKPIQPFRVLVTDIDGRPIPGAPVTFTVSGGGGVLAVPVLGVGASEMVTLSDSTGVAEAVLILGQETRQIPRFVLLEGDENATQVGLNIVTARSGAVALDEPFSAFGYPDDQFDGANRKATLGWLMGQGYWNEVSNLQVPSRFMWVSVNDPYGNPLSNIPIRFAYWQQLAATPPAGWVRLRLPNDTPGTVLKPADFQRCREAKERVFQGECEGEAPEVVLNSHIQGATAYPLPGSSPYVYYTFSIGTPDSPLQIPVYYPTWGPLCQGVTPEACPWGSRPQHTNEFNTRRRLSNSQGQFIEGYPTGGSATALFTTTGLYEREEIRKEVDANGKEHFRAYGTNQWYRERLTDSQIGLTPRTPGTIVTPITATSLDDGRYWSTMTMGSAPQLNVIGVSAKVFPWLIPYRADGSFDVDPAYVIDNGNGTYSLRERVKKPDQFVILDGEFSLWGVRPVVTAIDPAPVLLNSAFVIERASLVSYQVQPPELQALIEPVRVRWELRVGDELRIFRNGFGPAELYGGLPLSPVTHTARIQVFGLSTHPPDPVSIDSAPVPIPVCHLLDLETPKVVLQRTRDPLNNVTCGEAGQIAFTICRPSQVTVYLGADVLTASIDGAQPAPLTGISLGPGRHTISLDPAILGDSTDAKTQFKVQAVDAAEPSLQAEALGEVQSSLRNRSVLPVGRTFVKGVDLFDGHMVHQSTDIKVPGRHIGIEVTRTYSSAGRSPAGVMGAGWSFNYNSTLNQAECGLVNVTTPDGSSQVFRSLDGGVTFTPQKGYHTRLVRNADLSYDFFDKAGNRYHFREPENPAQASGDRRLEYVEEPHGDRVVLTYDTAGRVSRVAEVQGGAEVRALEVSYAKFGGFDRITRMAVSALNLQVDYQYDSQGNLVEAKRSGRNLPGGPIAEDRIERYTYSDTDTRDRHQIVAIEDPNRHRKEWVYYKKEDPFPGEELGLLITAKEEYVKEVLEFPEQGGTYRTRFSYDYSDVVTTQRYKTTVRDPRGNDTLYEMNGNGSPLRIEEPLGKVTQMQWAADDIVKTQETDPLGRVTDYGYDGRGNLTGETIHAEGIEGYQDVGIVESAFAYDPSFNKLTLKRDAEGRETRYGIDPATGDLLDMTDAVGNLTRYEYDEFGRLERMTDPRGYTTLYTNYDSFGNPRQITDPEGNVTQKEYDDRGRLARQTDSLGRETRTVYDGLDRPVEVVRVAGGDSDDEVTETDYYPGGEVKAVRNALGARTEFTLDGLNRVTATATDLGGGQVLRTKTGYDGNGNKTSETDRREVERVFVYDKLNRLDRVQIVRGPSAKPVGEVARYGYDLAGNKKTETNLAGLTTRFEYDALYRVVEKVFPEGAPPLTEKYGYDKVGNRTSVTDANGHAAITGYDGLNRVIRVVNPLNQVFTTVYDDAEGSHVNKSQDHDETRGLRTTYGYDRINREVERTVRLEGAGSSGEVYTTATAYDDGNHSVTVTDPRGNETRSVLNGLHRPVEVTVDPGGVNLVTRTVYDGLGNRRSVTDPNENVTRFVYDRLGRLTKTIDARLKETEFSYDGEGLKISETDRRNVRRDFTYDNVGRLVRTVLTASVSNVPWSQETEYQDVARKRIETDARGKKTTSTLDGLDRVVAVTDAHNETARMKYDGVNKREEIDRRGNKTLFDYDAINRLVRVIDPPPFTSQTVETTYEDAANRRIEKDRRGTQKVTRMDPLGRVLTVTRAGVLLEANTYDGNGNKTLGRDGEGKETRFDYDAANRLSARTDGFGSPEQAVTTFKYDKNGNLLEERDARAAALGEPFSVRNTYDALNRLTSVEDGEANLTRYDYDPEGNRTFVKEPEGQETSFTYDELGKLLTVTQPGDLTTVHSYDPARNRIRQVDARGKVVRMDYDDLNRLTDLVQDPGGLDLLTHHGYDENGNVLSTRDPKGQVTTFAYDELNRLTSKTYAFAAGDSYRPWRHTTRIEHGYDENGNLASVDEDVASGTDPPATLTTTRGYDLLDRLTSEVTTLPDGGTRTVAYSYFANGTRQTVTDPGGSVTSYTYDGQNRLKTATTASGTPQAATTSYSYFPDDLLETVSYPNGVIKTYAYDKADRLRSIVNAAGATVISSYTYGYDRNSNRLSQVEVNGGLTETTSYTYDALNRLKTVTYPADASFPNGRVVAYGYDEVGNRTSEVTTDPTTSAVLSSKTGVFDNVNRLTSLTDSVDPSKSATFTWDPNGNQTSKTVGTGPDAVTTEFRYDTRNQLVETTQGAGITGRFTYDFDGRRTKKIGLDGIRQYVYDDTSLFLEFDGSGTALAKYDYGSDRLISLTRFVGTDAHRRFYTFDGLGSVVNLTDPSGAVSASFHLDAWGQFRFPEELTPTDPIAASNSFAFTGYFFDKETKLHYAKARYYDSELGRFISQDTLTGQVDDPPSLHRFFYGRANPTRYIDPTGHQATKTFGELIEDAAVDSIYSGRATEAAKLLDSPDRDRKLAEWEKQALNNLPESMRARVREKLAEKQRQEWEHFKEAPDLFYKDPRVVEEGHEGSRWSGPIGEKVGPVLDWLGEKGGKVLDWFSKPLDDFAEKSGKDAGDFVRKQKSPGILEHQVKAVEEAGLEEFFPAGRVGTEFVETTAQVTEKVVEGGTKLAGPGAVRGGLRKAGEAAEELGKAARVARKGTTSQHAAELSRNLAREKRVVGEGQAAAHIVASTGTKGHWAASARSRALLERYGIDINDPANGIPLGHPRPHSTMHTRAFQARVEERLNSVAEEMRQGGYGRKATRAALRRELRQIGKDILAQEQ